MSKQKIIEVWVDPGYYNGECGMGHYIGRNKGNDGDLKAKLIIELPSRKKMLSEDDVRSLLHKYVYCELTTDDVDAELESIFGGEE